MTTSKQFNTIDRMVYKVDKLKSNSPWRQGIKFYENYEEKTGQKFKVIKTIDTNDPKNSHGYDSNGFQGMAVASVNSGGEVDYSHITVAYAGTNSADYKDNSEDIQGIGAGNRNTLGINEPGRQYILDSQFNSALKFYKQVHAEYPNANLDTTGHSLGGAMALFVASHFQVSSTVFSAPDPWKVMTNKERIWALAHPGLLTNYRHHGDLFSGGPSWLMGINGYTGTIIWSETTATGLSKVVDTHMLSTFKFDQKGRTKTLSNLMSSDVDLLQKKQSAITKLVNSLKSSGGSFTHAEKIAVDAVEAVSIADSLTKIAVDGISDIIQNYNAVMDEFGPLWEETMKAAEIMGPHLSHTEVMAELERAGVTRRTVVDEPIEELEEEVKALRDIGNEYMLLATHIKIAVDRMMETDTELAGMFNRE